MPKWLFAALLALQAHFAASYLVPLDTESQGAFGGLLRWAWPWSDGDSGPLGQVTTDAGFPFAGFILAMSGATLLILAALAVVGFWVPHGWWRALAIGGAGLSLALMLFFFGFTKLIPIALALFVLWSVLTDWVSMGWAPATAE